MKKILSLIVLLVAITACEEDIKFNTPAFQGLKDNVLWKATEYNAVRGGDNSLTVTATNGFEVVTLRTAAATANIYELGVNESSKATYSLSVDGIDEVYQTGTGVGNGIIEISDDPRDTDIAGGYVTGTFRFNVVNEEGDVINFQNGVFYKVPITTFE